MRAAREATNFPSARAVQNAWSEAVRSGTQERNVAGFTPMTLTGRPPALISAPSKAIVFRTPVILFSSAEVLAGDSLRRDDQQVGQDDLPERAGVPVSRPAPAPSDRRQVERFTASRRLDRCAGSTTGRRADASALQPASTAERRALSEPVAVARGPGAACAGSGVSSR